MKRAPEQLAVDLRHEWQNIGRLEAAMHMQVADVDIFLNGGRYPHNPQRVRTILDELREPMGQLMATVHRIDVIITQLEMGLKES
jgi:hypothetical protein